MDICFRHLDALSAPPLHRKEGKGKVEALPDYVRRHEQSLLAETLPLPASPYKGEEDFEIGSSVEDGEAGVVSLRGAAISSLDWARDPEQIEGQRVFMSSAG